MPKTLVAIVLVTFLVGCGIPRGTKNVGTGWDGGTSDKVYGLEIQASYEVTRGEMAYWQASWYGGHAPYQVSWNFGGGAEDQNFDSEVSEIESYSFESHLYYPTDLNRTSSSRPSYRYSQVSAQMNTDHNLVWNTFEATVTVTDANDLSATASHIYTIVPGENVSPTIVSMVINGAQLVVTADDPNGDEIEVRVSDYVGIYSDRNSVMASHNGIATFNFEAIDRFAGASSTVTVWVGDRGGRHDSATSDPVTVSPFELAPDTLYAIPMASSAAVYEAVTIVVATGATGAFQFMLNVGIVLPSDVTYVNDSFNVGAIGGAKDDADGVWAAVTSNGGFLLGPDLLLRSPGANPDDSLGTDFRFDFNISPLFGSDQASVEGALFNAQFSFSSAGTKDITFQAVNGVNRTYYSDLGGGVDTFWSSFVGGSIDVS